MRLDVPADVDASDTSWVKLMNDGQEPTWRPFVDKLLDRAQPDVVVAWTVNRPLQCACSERGLPLLHFELGPIRRPEGNLYYSDPIGLNGVSAVPILWPRIRDRPLTAGEESRLDAFVDEFVRDAGLTAKADDFRARCELTPKKPVVAVFFQVSRDSNVLAWSRVAGNAGLLEAVSRRFPSTQFQLLLKAHPADPVPPAFAHLDARVAPLCVAQQVIDVSDAVCLINSSVGIEALAAEKPLYVFGASPFDVRDCVRNAAEEDTGPIVSFTEGERTHSRRLLSFVFSRYLVGEGELNDPEAFAARLERLVAWKSSSGDLLEWFVPDVDARKLRDMRARRDLVRTNSESVEAHRALEQIVGEREHLRQRLDATTLALARVEASMAAFETERSLLTERVSTLTGELERTRGELAHVTAALASLQATLAVKMAEYVNAMPGVSMIVGHARSTYRGIRARIASLR